MIRRKISSLMDGSQSAIKALQSQSVTLSLFGMLGDAVSDSEQ